MSNIEKVTSFMHNLGVDAIDPISGFDGTIVGRVHYLYGCSQYGIATKKNADNSLAKAEYFDENRIDIISPIVRFKNGRNENSFDKVFLHPLGKKGRDKVTGFVGILTYAVEFLYGANQYGLTPEIDKDGKVCDSEQFDEGRIEIIDDGIKPEDVQVPVRGGVNRDAPSIR